MITRLATTGLLCTGLVAAALPAQAVVISATAAAATATPGTVPGTQDLLNGDFLILANPSPGTVTGDGVDEGTRWRFDFTGDPNYAAFMADGGIAGARLTLTLKAYVFGGLTSAPWTDIVRPTDGVNGVFPAWVVPDFMSGGTPGSYLTGTISESLITVGMNGPDLFAWLSGNGGLFPMEYRDDAIVLRAELVLVSTPVPEAPSWALMLGGAALGGWQLRRRARAEARSSTPAD